MFRIRSFRNERNRSIGNICRDTLALNLLIHRKATGRFMTLLFFFLSLAASTIGAISGIGGGIIIKPVLDATHTLSISTISFLSSCTVLSMSCVSILRNRKQSVSINYKMSTLLGIGAIIGGILGKELFEMAVSHFPSENTVGAFQAFALLIITITVYFYIRRQKNIHTKRISNPLLVILIGTLLGMISAFLGIGGGPLNIAVLYYFFSMSGKTAAINSLYIIFISQVSGLFNLVVSKRIPPFDWSILLLMMIGGIMGALIGYRINRRLSDAHVEKFFCCVLILIGILNIWNFYRFAF